MTLPSVGLIGIGHIGTHLVKQLRQAQYEVTAFDLLPAAVQRAVDLGATPADSVAAVARAAMIVLTSLPEAPDVEQVVLGEGGVLGNLASGGLLVDTSTSRPALARHIAAAAAARGLAALDAPVSWGEGGLNMMVGGDEAAFVRAERVLWAVAGKVTYVGPAGCGQVAKLMNQVIMAATWGIVAEAFCLAKKAGAPPDRVLEAINTAGASSRLLNGAVATMRRGDYTGSGTLRLHRKDLDYALDLAREVKAFVPLTGLVRDAFQAAELKGEPNWSQPGIAVVWEDLSGCSLADD